MPRPSPTPHQARATAARGDVLVMAGAGAGKTTTLVSRILDKLLHSQPPVGLDAFLVVTFTEAAAREMRQRLRLALEEEMARADDPAPFEEHLAMLETARVSTLHGFCLRLVREHFHELHLDPQFAVQDTAQTAVMREEILTAVLRSKYAGESGTPERVLSYLRRHARDGDAGVRSLILELHDHARSLPDPRGWLAAQRRAFEEPEPTRWRELVPAAIQSWAIPWHDHVRLLVQRDPSHRRAARCAAPLEALATGQAADLRACLREITEIGTSKVDQLHKLAAEAKELSEYFPDPHSGIDPLQEDWEWARHDALAVLDLLDEFTHQFSAARRATAVVDFSDLEQFAIELLWDHDANAPTPLAREWQRRIEFVLVDEYQDINGAQDLILTALSRPPGPEANRFFVGDVKQSIFRFRRANPAIFQRYAEHWRDGRHQSVVPLPENFRSHERILEFVNETFAFLMRREIGGVGYDEDARLTFGAPDFRPQLREAPEGRVELLLHAPPGKAAAGRPSSDHANEGSIDANSPEAELKGEEAQAAILARRLLEMRRSGMMIRDPGTGERRAIEWRDMVIIHPTPGPVGELWVGQFTRAGVPLEARRGGFFEALEVADLVNVARILDNPRQDLPLLAVLRSPIVGMTLDDLAELRLARPGGDLYDALLAAARTARSPGAEEGLATDLPSRAARFHAQLARWRDVARQGSIALCLETVLADTQYEASLSALPSAGERLANLRRLLALAREFDHFQRHGLFRFIQHLDAQSGLEKGPDAAPAAAGDCVRLISIHQSKGLEFPVVAVAGLTRRFNLRDLTGDWLVDDLFGLCPPVVTPDESHRYHSLPRLLAGHRQRTEAMGEHVRLLYVACTRAIERLVLTGSIPREKLVQWSDPTPRLSLCDLARALCAIDWLGPLLPHLTGRADWFTQDSGSGRWLDWTLHPGTPTPPRDPPPPGIDLVPDPQVLATIRDRLSWQYPWTNATRDPAKSAVTRLARSWQEDSGEASVPAASRLARAIAASRPGSRNAVEIGLAHHAFCQLVPLESTATREALENEARRLEREGWLTPGQLAALDFDALRAFWDSPLAREIRRQPEFVHRELPFTFALTPEEAARLREDPPAEPQAPGDFQVIQGVVDLAIIRPDAIQILDFKTDRVDERELALRGAEYATQLRLYALALAGIHRRPVTDAWLYFFAARRLVRVELADPPPAADGGH